MARLRKAILDPNHWYSPGSVKVYLALALLLLSFAACFTIVTGRFDMGDANRKINALQTQVETQQQESACRAAASNAVFLAIGNNVDGLSDHSLAIGDILEALVQRKLDPKAVVTALSTSGLELSSAKTPLRNALSAQAAALTTCKTATKQSNEQSGH